MAGKSIRLVQERNDRIAEAARQGVTTYDIARTEGVSELRVREILRTRGVESVIHRVGATKRLNPNTILDSIISTSEVPQEAIAALRAEWSNINRSNLSEWNKRLAAVIRDLKTIQALVRMELEHGTKLNTTCQGRRQATTTVQTAVGTPTEHNPIPFGAASI